MKKIILFLITGIFAVISCEKEQTFTKYGAIQGYTRIGSTGEPISGLKAELSDEDNSTRITNEDGYFKFEKVPVGDYTISIYQASRFLSSKTAAVIEGNVSTVFFSFEYEEQPKKDLPDILVVDISSEQGVYWDNWIMGENDYYYIKENENNHNLPKEALFYNFLTKEYCSVFFRDDGLPGKVLAGGFVFLFDNYNFNEGKLDLGILFPSGEIEINKGLPDYGLSTFLKSTKSTSGGNQPYSKSDLIRWTGRVLGAIPCILSGATAFASGGAAIPIALWVCGNYLLKMSKNFFDDAGVVNGYTKLVEGYNLLLGNYTCVTTLSLRDCLLSFAFAGMEEYADFVEEMEVREWYINKVADILANNAPLTTVTIQPDEVQGKDAYLMLTVWSDCSEQDETFSNSPTLGVVYDQIGACAKTVEVGLLQFSLSKIPLNAIISSAKLEVYGYATINYANRIPTISLSMLLGSWSELGVTWKNQPESNLIYEIDFTNEGAWSWYSWEVKNIVQDWITGRKDNFGFKISTDEESVGGKIYSSDNPDSQHRPKLNVSYY